MALQCLLTAAQIPISGMIKVSQAYQFVLDNLPRMLLYKALADLL
jgi:hypothetical protein